MCLTIPGKIVKIEGDIATLDYGSEKRDAKIIEGDYKVGDFVLVQAKVVVEIDLFGRATPTEIDAHEVKVVES